jgi:hypothetical protein
VRGSSLKIIISLFIILFGFTSFGDELDDFLDEDVSFETIDSLTDKVDLSEKKYRKYKPKEYVRVDPQSPVKFYAALEENSKLVNLKSGEIFYNERKLYVQAREIYYGGKWSYLISKSGQIKYKTHTTNLKSVEDVIELRSNLEANKVYPPKTSNHSSDKTLPIETHLIYRSETSNLEYIGNNLGYSEGNANSNTLSTKIFFLSFLPVDFGVVFDYQIGTLNFEDSDSSWSAAYLGPAIKWNFYDRGSFGLNTQLAIKKSLFFNTSVDGENVNFSNLLWQASIEGVYKTQYGNFSLGLESSFIRSSVKGELPERTPIQIEKETMIQNSIAVGYQFTWNL